MVIVDCVAGNRETLRAAANDLSEISQHYTVVCVVHKILV